MPFKDSDGGGDGGLGYVELLGGFRHIAAVRCRQSVVQLAKRHRRQSDFLMVTIHNYYFT